MTLKTLIKLCSMLSSLPICADVWPVSASCWQCITQQAIPGTLAFNGIIAISEWRQLCMKQTYTLRNIYLRKTPEPAASNETTATKHNEKKKENRKNTYNTNRTCGAHIANTEPEVQFGAFLLPECGSNLKTETADCRDFGRF